MKKILSAIISSPLKGRLGGVLFALLATTTLFGQYYSPISVTDGTAADWDALPAEYVASATHTDGCSYDGLKSVKVYCDDNYLNILVEVNLDVVTDLEWTPFHIFLNADGSAETGGHGLIFADADSEWLLETAIYAYGCVNPYNPFVFKWWGEVGGNDWAWTERWEDGYYTEGDGLCWGAIVCENSDPAVGDAQMVDGDLSKVEIQILKERVPAQWANEFTIGFEIEQSWSDVGHLPNAADDKFGGQNLAEKLKVKANVVIPETLEGLSYKITSDVEPYTVELSAAAKNLIKVNIPDTVVMDGIAYAVTSIGERAFYNCSSLTSLTIPNSVTSIGDYAFYYCSSLTSIAIPNSVTSIGNYAFYDCDALTSITIPNSVTSIGDYAFYNCSFLTSVTIPNSVTSIGDYAFFGCSSLTSVTIPNSVTSIGGWAFSGCSSLSSLTIPNSVTNIGKAAFNSCENIATIIVENGNSVYDSRENCNAIIETATNTLIAGCQNTVIPNGVACIGLAAFENCRYLTSITIPNSVTNIGETAFNSCENLATIMVENGNSVYDSRENCNAIIETATNTLIAGCQNTIIPNSVTEIGNYAFHGCSLSSISIPNSVISIGEYAFSGCSSLTSITIPNSVTSIGDCAFCVCTFLTSITIPNGVVSIGDNAFSACFSLTSLTSEASTPPTLGANVFPHISTIAVPCGAIEDYMASDWVTYADALVDDCNGRCGNKLVWKYEDSQLNIFGEGDMYDYDVDVQPWQQYRNKITSISLPEGLTSVGNAGFKDCMFVNYVSVPASVETIGFSAFENCRMLSNLTFAANGALTTIDNWAFYNNHELKNVVIPEGVTSIGYAAFYGCTYLSELTLPASMQAIEDNGFALCAKLQRMNVDAIVPPIVASRTFEDVDRTIPVVVPDESVSVYKSAPVWQEFNIQGKSEVPTALDNIHTENSDTRKLLRDGQLLILRDGKTYTIMGAEIH